MYDENEVNDNLTELTSTTHNVDESVDQLSEVISGVAHIQQYISSALDNAGIDFSSVNGAVKPLFDEAIALVSSATRGEEVDKSQIVDVAKELVAANDDAINKFNESGVSTDNPIDVREHGYYNPHDQWSMAPSGGVDYGWAVEDRQQIIKEHTLGTAPGKPGLFTSDFSKGRKPQGRGGTGINIVEPRATSSVPPSDRGQTSSRQNPESRPETIAGQRYASQGAAMYAAQQARTGRVASSQPTPNDASVQSNETNRFNSIGRSSLPTSSRNPGGRGVLHTDNSSIESENNRFDSIRSNSRSNSSTPSLRSQPSRNPGGRGVLHVDNSSEEAESNRFASIRSGAKPSSSSTHQSIRSGGPNSGGGQYSTARQGGPNSGGGQLSQPSTKSLNPSMINIINNLEKRYENDPKYGGMPQELKDKLLASTPGNAMSIVKEYWKEKGYSSLSPETTDAIRGGVNDALQGERYKGKGETMFGQSSQPRPSSESSWVDDAKKRDEVKAIRTTTVSSGKQGGGSLDTKEANDRREHIAAVQKSGGTVKQATEQLNAVDAIYASGDKEAIANWEKFVAAKQAEKKAAAAPITVKPTGVSGSADSMERQISSALAGQSAYVQSQVRAEINKGNKSSINDLVTWFSTQEKNRTTLKNQPGGVSGSADSMERQISSALAGQSSFVQSQVRAEINKGNKSSINDLVNWFKTVETNNKAASIPPVSRSLNAQTSRSPVPAAIPTPKTGGSGGGRMQYM